MAESRWTHALRARARVEEAANIVALAVLVAPRLVLGGAFAAGVGDPTKVGLCTDFRWVNSPLFDGIRYDWTQRDNCRRAYVRKRVFNQKLLLLLLQLLLLLPFTAHPNRGSDSSGVRMWRRVCWDPLKPET